MGGVGNGFVFVQHLRADFGQILGCVGVFFGADYAHWWGADDWRMGPMDVVHFAVFGQDSVGG